MPEAQDRQVLIQFEIEEGRPAEEKAGAAQPTSSCLFTAGRAWS